MAWNVSLVSDNEAIQHLFRRTFENRDDISLSFFASAEEARDGISGNPPDLLIISVNLPDMNGYDFCREMKIEKKVAFPVLMIEDIFEDIDLDQCLAVDTDGFIAKPFEEDPIAEKVEEVLRSLKQSTSVGTEVPSEMGEDLKEVQAVQSEEDSTQMIVTSEESEDILELTELVGEEEAAILEEGIMEEMPPSISTALEESVSELQKMESLELATSSEHFNRELEGPATPRTSKPAQSAFKSNELFDDKVKEFVEEIIERTIKKSLEEKLPAILQNSLIKIFTDLAKSLKE